ncbi:PQQ enzyme repeat family protein [Candidatus Endolissoclinum faulkneri L2]|uniref:PQQ enzyme repeat family protein n=2 Tax=Candidatus Endolissoclinum faulkneri TaxID=1263979 RepID=K7YG67_9PROT|nr:PQQ enzyme repeat family protein [Candidatus Endolissoclinum faulkneri L2]
MINSNIHFIFCFYLISTISLVGCSNDNFFGENYNTPLLGERMPVLQLAENLHKDSSLINTQMILPRSYVNANWSQTGGNASKMLGHIKASNKIIKMWSKSIGRGGNARVSLLSQPLVIEDIILVLDSEANLRAIRANNGNTIWKRSLRPEGEESAVYAGGIVADRKNVYAATGFGEIISFAINNGTENWRARMPGSARGAPTIANGRLFAVTLENNAIALSAANGSRIWEHQGITEVARLLGGSAAPAVCGSTVLIPYSSGQLFALRVETGNVVWFENLSSVRAFNAISRLADIYASPVIDNNVAFVISHAGRMLAIDMRSGQRIWERAIGSTAMPWVVGDYIFVVSLSGEVLAMNKIDGRIRWVQTLPRFKNIEDQKDPIRYVGPVMAGDNLLVGSSDGFLYLISQYTGQQVKKITIGDPIYVSPIVAGGKIYILDNNGQIHVFR